MYIEFDELRAALCGSAVTFCMLAASAKWLGVRPERARLPEWMDILGEVLGLRPREERRRWFHRKFHLCRGVVAWLNTPERTSAEQSEFAELLLRLDANPLRDSVAVLRAGALPGLRSANSGSYQVVFLWIPAKDEIQIISCK